MSYDPPTRRKKLTEALEEYEDALQYAITYEHDCESILRLTKAR